jgi:hypothetical protein
MSDIESKRRTWDSEDERPLEEGEDKALLCRIFDGIQLETGPSPEAVDKHFKALITAKYLGFPPRSRRGFGGHETFYHRLELPDLKEMLDKRLIVFSDFVLTYNKGPAKGKTHQYVLHDTEDEKAYRPLFQRVPKFPSRLTLAYCDGYIEIFKEKRPADEGLESWEPKKHGDLGSK